MDGTESPLDEAPPPGPAATPPPPPEEEAVLPIGRSKRAWFYIAAGARYGPIPQARLLDDLRRGELSLETQVWTPGLPSWVSVLRVAELREALSPPLERTEDMMLEELWEEEEISASLPEMPQGGAGPPPLVQARKGRGAGGVVALLLLLVLLPALWVLWQGVPEPLAELLGTEQLRARASEAPVVAESSAAPVVASPAVPVVMREAREPKERWLFIASEGEARQYLDRERVAVRSDSVVHAWYNTEFAPGEEYPVVLESGDTARAARLVESVLSNCRSLRFAYLSDYYYDGTGKLVKSYTYPTADSVTAQGEWREAVPDTEAEQRVRSACQQAGLPR